MILLFDKTGCGYELYILRKRPPILLHIYILYPLYPVHLFMYLKCSFAITGVNSIFTSLPKTIILCEKNDRELAIIFSLEISLEVTLSPFLPRGKTFRSVL